MGFITRTLLITRNTVNNLIVPTVPTDITISIVGTVVTFNFTKGTNSISTEFIVNGTTYTTDTSTLSVDILSYDTEFTYKARSISYTESYSDYTILYSNTTGSKPKVNLFNNNFLAYSSSSNLDGILYSSYAKGDSVNRTITHTIDGFSSSSAYIFTGFSIGKTYEYSVKVVGTIDNIFIRVRCLTSSNSLLSDTYELVGSISTKFIVPNNTSKIQIFVGTTSVHTGSSIFSNITVQES